MHNWRLPPESLMKGELGRSECIGLILECDRNQLKKEMGYDKCMELTPQLCLRFSSDTELSIDMLEVYIGGYKSFWVLCVWWLWTQRGWTGSQPQGLGP